MRPHGRQTDRRGRGAREQEDDYYGSVHGEGHSREGHGHPRESYHRDDAYRASTATHRSSYDANNESSAPRSHRDSWRTRDQEDIYGRQDGYQHQMAREDHAYLEREREPEHWPARPEMDTRYNNHSHSDWYDQPFPSTSYAEPSSHHRHPNPHDNTPSSYASWQPEDPYSDDRLSIGTDDRHGERASQARRGQYQPRKGNKHNKKFNTDSGWDRNKRRKGWEESSEPRTDNSQELAERKWEPAPSWKASNPESEDRSQGGQRYNNDRWSNSKSNKRVNNNNQKQRRDWRQEDDSLNNWTRRSNQAETSNRQTTSFNKVVKTPSRRKYQDSVSPSRSHSPTTSYRSRRSSRDRSRTRSVSPHAKRRRKDYSPNEYQRSGTPSEKGSGRQEIPPPRYDVEPSYSPKRSPTSHPEQPSEWHRRSPVSYGGRSPESRSSAWAPNDRMLPTWPMDPNVQDRGRSLSPGHGTFAPPPPRRRSISSISSRSSARSRSPVERSKTVHRLPSMDPTASTPLPPPKPEVTQTTGKKKKKKNKANGQNNNHQKNTNLAREVYPNPTMPPPSIIPPTHNTYMLDPTGDSQMGYSPSIPNASNAFGHSHPPLDVSPANQHSLPPRFTPIKSAGFKPITPASSSIKRFFNVDDDDVAPVSQESHSPSFVPAHQPLQPEQVVVPAEQPAPKVIYERPAPPNFMAPAAEPMESIQPLESQNALELPPRSSSPPISAPLTEGEPTTEEQVQTEDSRDDFYKIVSQVGEGTFGKVYKAENTTTKAYVALKRIRMESERDGFPVTAMREIKLLQSLRQTNIVQLYEMMISNGSIYMVFEYMDHDLTGILSQTQFSFEDAHLKSLCHQMLSGLAYLHQKGVIHRDIKGSNILLNNKGELKLGDFGLARFYQKRRRSDYTNRVITLWYRPPELLLGATVYGPEVDMWSAGCIMLELYTKKPVFQGLDEIHQLDVIYKILGTPDPQRWAGIMELPWYELIKPKEVIPNNFRELFRKWMSPAALDLAEQLLAYDPALRATAVQAMGAPYFTQEEPPASPPSGLATLEGEWHELETKRERAKKRRKPETAA